MIDTTFHLGDVIVSAIGIALTFGMRQVVSLVRTAVDLITEIKANTERLDRVELVVDDHSAELEQAGDRRFPRLSEK